MTNWWPVRVQAAALTVVALLATCAVAVALGVLPGYAAAYLLIGLYGLGSPAAIPVQVVAGTSLIGALLVGPIGAAPLSLVPLVVGVVATAELLGVVARLDAPIRRPAGDLLLRAGGSAAAAGLVYTAIVLIGSVRGPSGSVAVALGSAAAFLAALTLARWRGRT